MVINRFQKLLELWKFNSYFETIIGVGVFFNIVIQLKISILNNFNKIYVGYIYESYEKTLTLIIRFVFI